MADKRPNTDDAQDDTTHLDPNTTVIQPARAAKKPHTRSAEQSAADYLMDQTRIGQFNQYPLRKHRYIAVQMTNLLDALAALYIHLFKMHWDKFARVAEKLPLPPGITDHATGLAHVYISHWANDLYYMIRKSCQAVNPAAFIEMYHVETALYADKYDHFLTHVMNAIRPTAIVGAIADELYIPVLGKKVDLTAKTKVFGWKDWHLNMTTFQFVHQTLELKKVVKFTPISDDPMGRPSWLFDWFDKQAYAWFPQEQNYNEIDLAIAYIIGVACTPKVSLPDIDEWRYFENKINTKNIDVNSIVRVTQRRKFGTSEHRTLEIEEVDLPHYYETDKDKFARTNIGPLKLILKASASDETGSSEENEDDDDNVPPSPRHYTRSQSADAKSKGIRMRVRDYIYYTKVITTCENSTRLTAFKKFMAPPS